MAGLLSKLAGIFPGLTPRAAPQLVIEAPNERYERELADLKAQVERSRRRPAPRTEERIVRDYYHGYAGRVWFLPHVDSTVEHSQEIRTAMRKMRNDGFVKAAWEPQILTVASEDWQVQPSEPGNQLAEEQADFVKRVIEEYTAGGMPACVRAITAPLGGDGAAFAEKVRGVATRGRLQGKIVLEALKAKDPDDLRVEGDQFGNVLSVRSTREPNLVYPITDFAYSRYMTVFDEPFGEAAFRPAYGDYWMRDTVRKLRIIHMEKKAAGTVIGTYMNEDDKPPLEAALRQIRSQTWAVVPDGVKIEAVALSQASEPDYKSFDESLTTGIVTAIAFASLQILQGNVPDARGDTKIQKSMADLGPWLLMTIVCQVFNEQIIPELIDYNFPYPAGGCYPRLTFGATSNAELLELIQVVQGAQAIGLVPSRKHYAKALSIQEADPADPDDQLGGQGGGMGGFPPPGGGPGGFGGGGFGGAGPGGAPAADPFAPPDPFAAGNLFSEGWRGRWHNFAWQAARSATGNTKAVGTAEHQGQTLYGRQAEAALARQGRVDRNEPHPETPQDKAKRLAAEREPARQAARDLFAAAVADPAKLTAESVQRLGAELPNLTVAELKNLANNISIASGGLKEDLVARLVRKVGGKTAAPANTQSQDSVIGVPAEPVVGKVYNVRPDELQVDPTRFQYKQNVNAAGVTDELKTVGKWNPDFAGTLAVWKDPANGKTYVINGHHRHDLAKRLGAPDLAVRYIDARDATEARAKGALINIAEGRGTAIDAAKFMRDAGVGIEDFKARGVPIKDGALAANAVTLTRLGDKAFDRLTRGQLDLATALGVAKHVSDPARQEKLFGLIADREAAGKPVAPRTVEEMARAMAATPAVTTTENTLWGPEDSTDDVFVQRAELAGFARSELAKELGDYAALSSKRRAGATSAAGNVLNIDENRRRAAEAEQAKTVFDKMVNLKGPVSEALNKAAVEYAGARTPKERNRVRAEAVAAVRAGIAAEFAGLDARTPGQANARAEGPAVPGLGDVPRADAATAAGDVQRAGAEPAGLTAPALAAEAARRYANLPPSQGAPPIPPPEDVRALIGRAQAISQPLAEAVSSFLNGGKSYSYRMVQVARGLVDEHDPGGPDQKAPAGGEPAQNIRPASSNNLSGAGTPPAPAGETPMTRTVKPKKVAGGQIDGGWSPNDGPNGGVMSYGGRRLKGGGEVIGVGGEHPEGVVTAVDVGRGGKVTYTVRPYTPEETAARGVKAAKVGRYNGVLNSGGADEPNYPASLPAVEWEAIDPPPADPRRGGKTRYVGTLPDGRTVAKTVTAGYDDVREVYHLPAGAVPGPADKAFPDDRPATPEDGARLAGLMNANISGLVYARDYMAAAGVRNKYQALAAAATGTTADLRAMYDRYIAELHANNGGMIERT